MSNKHLFSFLAALIVLFSLAGGVFAGDGTITVAGLLIDKTDKNAVVARDAAIVEAQKTAFQILAQKSMSPEAYKDFTIPDNKTIAVLVQDFEIKNEQMTSNRYVASFTVRFGPDINGYMKLPADLGPVINVGPVAATTDVAAAAATTTQATDKATDKVADKKAAPVALDITGPRNILVLPYLRDAAGKKLLWEDPNPWRDTWQANGNQTPGGSLAITVPQGDLADVATGSSDAAFAGNFTPIEKLRAAYKANEVALAVAYPDLAAPAVDVYLYREGKLLHLKPVTGLKAGEFVPAVKNLIAALKSPQLAADEDVALFAEKPAPTPADDKLSKPNADKAPETPAKAEKTNISVIMNFSDYSQWMDAQRKLATISPPMEIDIGSVSSNAVQFKLTYDGGMEAFKAALANEGLSINKPIVEVDESVIGSDKPTQKTLYELTLAGAPAPQAAPDKTPSSQSAPEKTPVSQDSVPQQQEQPQQPEGRQ